MFRQVLHNYIVYHRQRACPKSSWPSYALWSKGQTLCTYMYEHEQVGIMSWLLLSRHYNKFNFIVITYSLAQLFGDNRSDFMIINTCCKLQTIFLIKKKTRQNCIDLVKNYNRSSVFSTKYTPIDILLCALQTQLQNARFRRAKSDKRQKMV